MGKSEKKMQRIVKKREIEDKKYEQYKKNRSKRKKRTAIMSRIFLLILVLILFIFCVTNLNYLTPGKIGERFGAIFADMGSGDGFPHTFDSGNILSFDKFNDKDYVVLTNTKIIILNSSCKEVLNYTHGMANPIMHTSIDRILLYDQGGNELFVINQKGVLLDVPVSDDIICADICKDGKFIVALNSDTLKKTVNVYSRKGGKVFTWMSGSGYIVDVGLNDGGSLAAVGIIDTDGAVSESEIHTFSVSSAEQKGSYVFSGSLITDTAFGSANNVIVMLNDKIAKLNAKCALNKEMDLPSHNNYQLYMDASGNIINLYSLYNNSDYKIDVYNSSLKLKYTKECGGNVLWTYSDGGSIAVLYNENRVEINKIGGKVTYSAQLSDDFEKIICKNNTAYLCRNGYLEKVKVKRQ